MKQFFTGLLMGILFMAPIAAKGVEIQFSQIGVREIFAAAALAGIIGHGGDFENVNRRSRANSAWDYAKVMVETKH